MFKSDLDEIAGAAAQIPGWMSQMELKWLAKHAFAARGNVIEIGSWQGRSTLAMAMAHRLANNQAFGHPGTGQPRIFAIDTWAGSVEHAAGEATKSLSPETLYAAFHRHLADYINREVWVCQLESVAAAQFYHRLIAGGGQPPADMIFIDADHSYDQVKADIEAWLPCLAPRGTMCGHDFNYPQVALAVNHFFDLSRLERADSIWSAIV